MLFTQSLKKNYQFRYIYKKGKSFADKFLVIYIVKNNKKLNQLGISVSKKVGKSVIRSKVTRLIRENYRLNEKGLKKGYDIVIVARPSCNKASYYEISKSLKNLLKRHNLYI